MQYLTNRLVILSVIVVIVVMAAIVTFKYKQHLYGETEQAPLFFPELTDNLEQLSTIEITHKDSSLVIEKIAGEWTLSQKGGYQVDISKVRQLVLSLTALEKLEAKTSNPEKFSFLNLESPSKDNDATRIILFDNNGQALADVIIGSLRRTKGSGFVDGAFYIRNSNENQTWLVKGNVDVSLQENDWVNRELLRLNNKHVAAVDIVHPKTTHNVSIKRLAKEDGNVSYELVNLPKGKKLSSQMDIDAIVDVVRNLNFLNVEKLSNKKFNEKNGVTATYHMDGGLDVILSVYEEKESKSNGDPLKYWITITYNTTAKDEQTQAALKETIGRLKQYDGWAYEIGGYQGKLLTKTLQRLTAK